MIRLIRFLILTLTLGRIRWLMRLTWFWRLIVFLGITGWLARQLRSLAGLDRKASTDVDSAWADALRYTPTPAPSGTASAPGAMSYSTAPAPPAPSATESVVEESISEVVGYAADGSSETITMHEVRAGEEAETIVRIEDETGNVETLVTGSPVEDIDLANLGEPAAEAAEPVIEVIEVVEVEIPETEILEAIEIAEILDLMEAAEPEPEAPQVEPAAAKPKRTRTRKPKAEPVAEPLEITDEDPDLDVVIDPDWVRGDGTEDCPESHPVKAKASSMIYYAPESRHYSLTIPDVCFASSADAEAAGYRAPRR